MRSGRWLSLGSPGLMGDLAFRFSLHGVHVNIDGGHSYVIIVVVRV